MRKATTIHDISLAWPMLWLLMLSNSALAQTGGDIRAHAEVIPESAITNHGLWTVHHVGDKLYFEFPAAALDADLVVFKERKQYLSKYQLIRWERHGGQVLLRSINTTRLGQPLPLGHKLSFELPDAAPVDAIVAVFPITAVGADGAAVIDVTHLFIGGENAHWHLSDSEVVHRADAIRGVEVRAFPENVIVRLAPRVAWNFVRLPERPMTPRLYDRRVGFRGIPHGDPDAPKQVPIQRWRLEKKDPSLPLSEPLKPIVIYLDPETPAKWRPWIRRGIEEWQPAFEAAGFKRAVVAKDPPDDPDWSYDDVRHSVLCWRGCGGRNWMIHDPRTGERLQFQIGTGGFRFLLPRYIVSLAAVDARVLQSPFPEAVAGEFLRANAAHETGHLLGLIDGKYGTFAYTVDQVRSHDWVHRMSFTPSVINYTRFNYVAQPEDGMPPGALAQRVGPADVYSIRWGYTPIPWATSPEEELPILNAWIKEQEATPMYRFRTGVIVLRDPGPDLVEEAVEVTDPVEAARLGLRNLKRSLALLHNVTLKSNDADIQRSISFDSLYDAAWEQWMHMIVPVATLIGGRTLYRGEHPHLDRWTPVTAEVQRRAMAFLGESAFHIPPFLIAHELLSRRGLTLEEAVEDRGMRLWRTLFSGYRFQRLAAAEGARSEEEAPYTLTDALADLRAALWSELEQPEVQIDAFRRGLQRKYVALLESWASAPSGMGEFERSRLSAELEELQRAVRTAITRAGDAKTQAHLRQLFASESLSTSKAESLD